VDICKSMKDKKIKETIAIILAAIGLALTAAQIVMHLNGQELCFNQGCKIVENVLTLNPLIVNGLGLLFFLSVILLMLIKKKRKDLDFLLDLLLLCALVAEGILLSIQLFVVQTFCSYCLLVASIIILTSTVYKTRIAILGLAFITVELAIFSFINLSMPLSRSITLNQGTYAVKTCSNPRTVAYLIFSENCPHCKKVLSNLNGCVRCEIHFNPISKIDKEILPGLIPIDGYSPEINLLALNIFDINSVPVLINRTDNGYKIIKGDEKILDFIKTECFCPGSTAGALPFVNEPEFLGHEEGVCSLKEECK